MKYLLLTILCLGGGWAIFAQNSALDLTGVDRISIKAQFSELIIKAGPADQASFEQLFTISGQSDPEMKKLAVKRSGSTLMIEEIKPTLGDLQERFPNGYGRTINGDTATYYTRSMIDGNHPNYPMIKAKITIILPADMPIEVENEYGPIRVEGMKALSHAHTTYGAVEIVMPTTNKALTISSDYGAVDLSLDETANANLKLSTDYGALYTDFDIDINTEDSRRTDFGESVVGTIGNGGTSISCKAPYGNVYLRRLKN